MAVDVQSQRQGVRTFIRLHQTKLRFLLVGALNTAFGLAAYPALYFSLTPLGFHYLVVLGIAQIVCVTFSFLTTKFMVFRTSGNYLREAGKFAFFHLSYFIANLIALPVLVEVVHMPPVYGQTAFASLVVVSSYFWHSKITFASASKRRGRVRDL
jgi:putative flippase GtrA